jgi:hypothetical protein
MTQRGLVLIVLGCALAVWPVMTYVTEFIAVDACLDAGGSFDYGQSRCDRARTHPVVAYSARHPMLLASMAAGGLVSAIGVIAYSRRSRGSD